ncbi:hypothetical protein [Leifsonia sp. WHRI 6310E]
MRRDGDPQLPRELDVDTNTAANGNRAQLWTCGVASGQNGLWTQQWSLPA